MAKFSFKDIEYKLAFYKNIIKDMTDLLTPVAVLFYLEYFSQYLLVKYAKITEDKVLTGAHFAGEISNSLAVRLIVQVRNAIVHCDRNAFIDLLDRIANLGEYDTVGTEDTVTLKGIAMLSSVDWKRFYNYITRFERNEY